MAERFEPQMGRQPWLNELGKQDRRGVFPQFILDVDKASFTHRPMLHSKELHDHLHGTLDPMVNTFRCRLTKHEICIRQMHAKFMNYSLLDRCELLFLCVIFWFVTFVDASQEFLKLRQSASAAEAHRTAKKAMRSGLSSIYSSKKAAPVSPSPMQTSTSKASRPGSAPSSTRSRAFSAAATWDVWTSTRQIGVVRFRKNPAQLTLHDLRTVVARQVPELPRDFQFMYEDGVLIHRAQERTLRTKRQHKTKKVFVHFLEDFDDQDKKKSAGFTDRKLPIKIKTSMRPTLILDSPAQPIKTTSKPIAPSVAASPSSAFVAAAPVEATTKKCPFKDTPELKNVTARPDMQPPRIESSTQTAIDSIPFTPQEVHDQTNTSPTSWSMVTAIRKQIAHHEELAAKTIQILVRHVLKVRRQARERDRMRIADAEAAAAREQSRIELERAQKVAADSAALKAEQEARESAITLKEEAERAERARLEAEAAAERARQAAVTMDVTSAHGIDGAKVAALLLQQFQYQEAIKTNAATALIQNLARKRIAKRPKKPPSPTEEERMAHIDELAAEEMACAKRDAQQANEALALANQTKASIAREAEVAAEKVARTEAIAARARARFTRVKSRLKAMRVLGKVSNSARGFPQSTVPSLEKPFEPTKAAAEVVDNTAQGIFSDFTLEKATRTNSAGMVSVKSSLETAARPVKSEASKFPSLEPDSLYDASSYSEKVTFWVENMQLPTEARLRTQGVPESPIQDSVDIADSSRCERLEQKALNAISDIQELTTSDSNTAGSNIATKQIIEMQRKRSSLASKTSRAETSIEAGKTTEKSASKTLKSTVPGLASSIQATDAHHTASSLQIDPPASALFFEEDWNFLEKPLAEAEAAQAQVRLADAERNVNNLLLMEVAAKARVRAIAAKSAVEKQKIASEAVARRKAREREAETCAAQTLEVQKLKSALAKGGLEHQQYLKYLKDVAAYEAHYKKVIEEGAHQRALLENCTLHGELCLHARHSKSWWLALRSLSTVQILCADGLEDWERRRGLYESPKPSIDTPDSKQSSLHCCEVPEERDHTNTTSTSISLPGDPEDVLNSDMERSSMEEECQFPALTSEPTECEDSLVSDGGSTGTSVSITSLPQASAPDLGIEDDAAAAAASSLRRLNTAIDSSCVISEAYRSSPQKRLSPPLPELPLDQWSATGRATVTTPPLTWDCSSALFQADISCNSESNALLGARPTLKLSPASFEPSPHTPLPVDNRLDGCRTPDESQVFSILDVGQSCSDPDFGNYAWMAPAEILLSPRPRLSAASDRETLEELKMPTLNLSDTFPLAFRNDGDGKADSFSSPLHTPTAILGNPATSSGTDHSGMSETALFPLDAPLMSVQTATASLGQPATLSARENKDLPESAYLPLDTPAAPTHPSPLVAMAASIREGSCFNDLNSAERDICDVVRPRTVVPDIKPEVTAAFEPFSTPALEVALSPQLRDFMDAPILGLEHASVEAENNLMGCLSATRLVPSFRINDDQAVPLTEAVNDFLTHSLEALPSALLATNNALDELLGGNVHIDNQFGDEALKDDIDQAEVDEVVPHSCSSMDENFATSTAKLAAKNATIVTAAISRVIARQGVRFDDGRRLAAWLEQSSTGSGVRTAHAYDPLGSETFAATVTPSIWAAAVTEALNHFNSASSVTAGSEGPSIKGSRSEAAGDASDESDATAAHVLLGWLSVSASKGLAIDVPEKTISQLNEPLSPQLRTMEHIEKVSCQPLFEKKMKRSGDDRDAPFHRCVTKLIDGRRFMVWLQYGNDASFQDHDCTVHAFDPLSAQTYTCAVTPETWKAAQEIIMHYAKGYERNDKSTSNNSENLKDGQDESAIQVMPSTSVTENIASEAEDIIFDWLRLNHTQGLHFRELQNSIREAECCRGNTLNVIDTSEPKKERMMTQNSNIHRMTSLRNIRSLSPNRVLSTTEPVIMLASADGRKNSLRNLESLSPSHATSAMEPKDEVISTNFLEPGSNLTPRSGSNDEGSQDTNASRRTLFDYSDDLKISPENESLDSYSLDDNDSQEVLTARSTSSTGYFGEDDENVMIDIFRHPWRALQYNLPGSNIFCISFYKLLR